MKTIRWGVVGAGAIAKVFCNALQFSKTGTLAAVASKTAGKATELANMFGCDVSFTNYDSLFASDVIDAVYIATVHPFHSPTVLAALANGKHVLVEKPISTNVANAQAMVTKAREHQLFLMEGFMYRCHPQIPKMVELIQAGSIGDVRFIRSDFGYSMAYSQNSRNFDKRLGGGAILDVGCYPISMCRLIAGAAAGAKFLNPIDIQASAVTGPTGVDHYASAILKFENDIVATATAAITCEIPPATVIYGSDGILSVPNPWLPSSPCRVATERLPANQSFPDTTLLLARSGETDQQINISVDRDLFSYEIDAVGDRILRGELQSEKMNWDDSIGNMNSLCRWLAAVGVKYP